MGGEEVKIKCPECGGMYPQQDCGHQGLKLATLRAENVRLKADNLDLINNLEGEGYRLERLQARIAELKAALEAADAMGIAVNDWLEEKVRRENYKMEVGNTPPVDFLERAKVLNAELSRTYADWVIAAAALKGDADDEG